MLMKKYVSELKETFKNNMDLYEINLNIISLEWWLYKF